MARFGTAIRARRVSVTRVALLCPYALSVYGGVQEQVLAMARTLDRRGLEVMIVAPDSSDRANHGTNVRIERFGHLLSIPANGSRAPVTVSWAAARAAQRAIAQFAPQIVHLHEPFAPIFGYQVLRTHAVASVATFHRAGGGPAYSLTRPVLMRFARGIDCATAVSALAAETIYAGAAIDSMILFNGFETERLREYARVTSAVSQILFLGRLEVRKGARTFLDAARLANVQHPQWHFVVAGEGPEGPQLRREFAELRNVEFRGAVSDDQKRTLLRHANVLVAPATHGESFGLVLLEAMAAETAVVASDIDGYRAAAGGHATLFSPRDPLDLVRAIQSALVVSSEQISEARRHAENWSMESLMDRYSEIYEQALSRFVAPQ